jgi:Putative auto-transporter adhesin, head GIN domain
MKIAACILFAAMGLIGSAIAQQEQVRSVSGFTSIGNSASFAVHVKINGTESLKIVGADAEQAGKIETKVEGGHLEIGWREGSHPDRFGGRIDIYITAKTLSGVDMSGSGMMEVDGSLTGSHVVVTASGSGSLVASVDGAKLEVTMSGSGRVGLKGKTGSTDITMSGSGGLHADGLTIEEAKVDMSGSGLVEIHVDKTLSAEISGSGGVHYSGNGSVSSVTTSGSGRVRRV